MYPIPSLELFERKRGRCGSKNRKSVSRHIHQNLLSKNKCPVYAYADKLNIFTSYHIKGWHAYVFGGKICDEGDVDSVGVMEKYLAHSSHFINST